MKIVPYFKDIVNLPLVKNTLKLSSSSVILMFLPLLVTPILSRLYTPSDYGDWGLFASFVAIINSFLFFSYENTIVKSKDSSELASIICLCLGLMGLVFLLVLCFFYVGSLFGIRIITEFPSLPLLLVSLFFSGITTLCTNLANREKLYGKIAISNVINGLAQAVFRILLGFFPVLAYGLIVGNVLALLLPVIFLLLYLSYIVFDNKFWRCVSFKSVLSVASKYKKFPLFDAPARLIEFLILNLAPVILIIFCSKEKVGSYSMIAQFIMMPMVVVGTAMANVFYREITESGAEDSFVALTTKRVAKIAFFLSFLPILFFSFGGDKLLVIVLGKQWISAGNMALCMVGYSMPVILSEPLLPIFRALEKQDIRFVLNCLCILLSLGGLTISLYVTNSIYISLLIYSALYSLVRYVMFFKELHLVGLSWKQISPYFIIVNIVCYFLLGIRVFWELCVNGA